MSIDLDDNDPVALIHELCRLPRETEQVEFKRNKAEPEEIGENISALANSAFLGGHAFAYVVWGIDNETHDVVGTSFNPHRCKVGNEELESWLLHLLKPQVNFRFFSLTVEALPVVLLEISISRALNCPVRFRGVRFIRIGSYTKKLKEHSEKERALWNAFKRTPFEADIAAEQVSGDEVRRLLDYDAYFNLLKLPVPTEPDGLFKKLEADKLIQKNQAGGWDITNLGAVLFAQSFSDFPEFQRKAMRVIQYHGTNRLETQRERGGSKGYAIGFERLIEFIMTVVPSREVIQRLRTTVSGFPELAVRELVANALIHQDFSVTGAGPMVEIFEDRIEFTNPGKPLVNPDRFLDSPPISRNDALAALMRRFGICEERGSGIDKVVSAVEAHGLPAPLFEDPPGFTRATLFAYKPVKRMDKNDRIRACYLHACLKYQEKDFLTNSSLRQRFGIDAKNKATVSRYIREAVEDGKIKPFEAGAAKKIRKYIPFWG